ncbi:hypothetical protein [Isoptericola haloaureus]|uniref:Gfo/Idh/MocA-like oxidoreductase N-terminal domain-containing protein n=1 Tax=Isoptericola haloaureus TaxID=1542902 RepID=A0ABU7Z9X2_9MICO
MTSTTAPATAPAPARPAGRPPAPGPDRPRTAVRTARRRTVLVGDGPTAEAVRDASAGPHADVVDLVADLVGGSASSEAADVDRLVRETAPDVVVVASSRPTAAVVAALDTGADVVLDGAPAGAGEIYTLAEAVRRAEGRLSAAFDDRYAAAAAELRRVVADGRLGTVVSAHAEWLHANRDPRTAAARTSRRADLLGWWIDDVPVSVFAQGPGSTGRASGVASGHGMVLGYQDGATVTCSETAGGPRTGYRVAVNGTLGRADLEVVHGQGARLVVHRHGGGAGVVLDAGAVATDGRSAMLRALLAGTDDAGPLRRRADGSDLLRAAGVAAAAARSAASGRAVPLSALGLAL